MSVARLIAFFCLLFLSFTSAHANPKLINCHFLEKVFGKRNNPIRLSSIDVPIDSLRYATEPAASMQSLFKVKNHETVEVPHMINLKKYLSADEYARLEQKHKTFTNQDFVAKRWSLKDGVLETEYFRPESAQVKIRVNPILNFSTKNRYQAFKAFDSKQQQSAYARIKEMNNRGFDLSDIIQKEQEMTLLFKRNPQLLDRPAFQVPAHVNTMDTQLEKGLSSLPPPKEYYSLVQLKETEMTTKMAPSGKRLSSKTLDTFESDVGFPFSLLRGESSLRYMGNGHLFSSGSQAVETAGEFLLKRNEKGQLIEVWFKPQSGKFQPDASSLRRAIHAMWRQGVYPPKIKIFSDTENKWESLIFETR